VDLDQKHEQEDNNVDEALPIHYTEVNLTSLMLSLDEYIGMAALS
jgi:ribosomal protein L24